MYVCVYIFLIKLDLEVSYLYIYIDNAELKRSREIKWNEWTIDERTSEIFRGFPFEKFELLV